MPWVACESADKHAGGKNTNNNTGKMLLWRERCTELQLLQGTRDGPGPDTPPTPFPCGFALCDDGTVKALAVTVSEAAQIAGCSRHLLSTALTDGVGVVHPSIGPVGCLEQDMKSPSSASL